ncbi:MAG TPA: leishmanolysin-related zinc metalloendopeptidase, partial [Longimicrobiales bacterium]
QSETQQFTLTVSCQIGVVCIETVSLPPALVGFAYDTQLEALGGDGSGITWTVESGTLPPGLTLEPSGRIHGTPTAADTVALLLRAAGGSTEATQTYTLQVVANRTGTYDITIAPVVPIPAAFVPIVDAAIARWQSAIVGDLPARSIATGTFGTGECGGFGQVVNGTAADDIIVLVNIDAIDGRGSVLGFAGPCLIRQPGNLPIIGVLTLDAVDLGFLSTEAQIALVTHEIGHALGFGSLWDTFDLISASSTDPRYLGSEANEEWQAIGGSGQAPIENSGGEGTARSHWRESVFGRELMTGFSNTTVFQPLSRMSIASFADLGYTVNLAAADAFNPSATMSASQLERTIDAAPGYDVVYDGVVGRVDATGRLIPRSTP